MQQTTNSWQPTKRGHSASNFRRQLQCIVGETTDFPGKKTKQTKSKRLVIQKQIDEPCMRTESRTYPPFSKSGLGAIRL